MFPEHLSKDFGKFVESFDKPAPDLFDKNEIIPEIKRLLENAINIRAGNAPIAIAFSGGLDSLILAFLCDKLKKKFHLYSIGTEGAPDLESAQKVANYFGWPITIKVLNQDYVESLLKEAYNIIPNPDVIKMGIGAVVLEVLRLAKNDGHTALMVGLGAEEIFAGYNRHENAMKQGRLHEECWAGLYNLFEQDLSRDGALAANVSMKLFAPFLDKPVIAYAMRIVPELKLSLDQKKIILCDMAVAAGIPKEFAMRKKKAMQYGSYFDKEFEKIAKKRGFNSKKDYMNSLK
ncbi:MAG: asparagine synthase C-terminal domain-containing protein [Nanoarchaeota archaeon]